MLFLVLSVLLSSWSNDMIVLLDTSESMFGEFDSTVTYLIKDILQKYLNLGDYFHLLIFDSTVSVEIDQMISKPEDGADIIKKLALINPFGKYTDLIEALQTLYAYANDLNDEHKINIVILTDGMHDPPPGKYSDDGAEKIAQLTKQLADTDWNINIVELSGDNLKSSELTEESGKEYFSGAKSEAVQQLSEQLDAQVLDPESEEDLLTMTGGIGIQLLKNEYKTNSQKISLRFSGKSYNKDDVEISFLGILYNNINILSEPLNISIKAKSEKSFTLDLDFKGNLIETKYIYPITLFYKSNAALSPENFDITVNYVQGSANILPIILIIVFAAIIAAIIIVLIIKSGNGPKQNNKSDENKDYSILGPKAQRAEEVDENSRRNLIDAGKVKGSIYFPEAKSSGQSIKSENIPDKNHKFDSEYIIKEKTSRQTKSSKIDVFSDIGKNKAATNDINDTLFQKSESAKQKSITIKYQEGENADLPNFPHVRVDSLNKNVKFLLMLNLKSDLNSIIAGHKVQKLEKGKILTLGPGNASFFVFFTTNLPDVIAEIKYNGKRCSFSPLDFKYFPDLKAPLEDCINKKIRIVYGGEEQVVTFKEWLSPLEEINRIMRLIDYQGLPKSPWEDDIEE